MKKNPRRSLELQHKARALLQQNKLSEALSTANDACKHDPGSVDAWFTLAAIHAQQQNYAGIIDCCSKAIKLQPKNATAHFNLGLAQQSLGQLPQAIEAYRKALQVQANYPAAQLNLAAALLGTGAATEALAMVDAILARTPSMPEAISLRGNALLKLGQAQAALDWFQQQMASLGRLPQLLHGAASCLLALDDGDAACAMLTELSQSAPSYAPAWAELGHIERHREQFAKAAEYYERAARLQPSRENRFNLAHCLYGADKIEPACRVYLDLLQQYPDDHLIHNNLGRLYERIGRVDEAATHFQCAVDLQPNHATPLCNLGRMLLGLGRLPEALQAFDRAIALDSDYHEGHFGRGQTLIELGDTEAAIAAFRAALERKPDLSLARHYIASLGGADANDQDSKNYVADLFDHFAEKFDNDLLVGLKYKTPDVLYGILKPLLQDNGERSEILDLGCGTGLCGPLFKPHATRLVGVDLSGQMIEKARERGCYDELRVEDIVVTLQHDAQKYDLIIAADVFVYIGDLSAVFKAAHASLKSNGLFAFSTETCDGSGFRIRSSGRHAHSRDYINQLATQQGFTSVNQQDSDLRMEYGKPVGGTLYVFRADKH